MSRIKGANTKPELLIRKALHARGLRFRLHRRDLAGRPDIVLARHHTVIFVHGCFWHAHNCHLATKPQTRTEFWQLKIHGNALRDQQAIQQLEEQHWKVGIVWECALRGPKRQPLNDLLDQLETFIKSEPILTQHFTAQH